MYNTSVVAAKKGRTEAISLASMLAVVCTVGDPMKYAETSRDLHGVQDVIKRFTKQDGDGYGVRSHDLQSHNLTRCQLRQSVVA